MSFKNGLGGFLGLDQDTLGSNPCPAAIADMANGRSSFAAIIELVRPSKVYLPWYICPVMLDVLENAYVEYEFFPIDETLHPVLPDQVLDTDVVVLVNYFGICGATIDELAKQLSANVVIDNAQAFFYQPADQTWAFNSARKFFGVPDGSWLFGKSEPDLRERASCSTDHLEFRNRQDAYQRYTHAERSQLITQKRMSLITRALLGHTDMVAVAQQRKTNFKALHNRLHELNALELRIDDNCVPLCYPFLPKSELSHGQMHSENVWVPRYWPDMPKVERFNWESRLVDCLLPLPIDQRYNEEQINSLGDLVTGLIGKAAS